MANRQTRARRKGYSAEVRAKDELNELDLRLARTGSVNYKKDAPDLEQDGDLGVIRIVAIGADRQPLLYCMTAADLEKFLYHRRGYRIVVQVKKRQSTWLHTVWKGLVGATS